jgi:hypothetical protein
MIVPITPQSLGQSAPASAQSLGLDPNFALMAATQMHSEGRLVQPGSEPIAQPKPKKPTR